MKKIIFLIIFLLSVSVVTAWDITITAENQLEPIVLGVDKDATADYDIEFDVYSSTPIQDKVIMSINNIYARSYIGENDESTWNIMVGVPSEQTTEVKWELKDVPRTLDLFMTYNSNQINMKDQNSLQVNEGSYEMVIKAGNSDSVEKKTSSSGSRDTSSSSTSSSGPDSIAEDKEEKTEKVLKAEDILPNIDTIKEQKEIEQITTKEEPKNLNFIGILIIISIIVIGLLIYFITTKITGGSKNE